MKNKNIQITLLLVIIPVLFTYIVHGKDISYSDTTLINIEVEGFLYLGFEQREFLKFDKVETFGSNNKR